MDIEHAEHYGEALLDYAFDMLWLRKTCGVNHAEFIFVRMDNLLKEYPVLKKWFLCNLQTTLANQWLNLDKQKQRPRGFIPDQLVEYIAHMMKWPDFMQLALYELNKHQNDKLYLINRNLPGSIIKALEPNWEDRDMYPSLHNANNLK